MIPVLSNAFSSPKNNIKTNPVRTSGCVRKGAIFAKSIRYFPVLAYGLLNLKSNIRPCGQKTHPGRCLEIIAQRTLMKSGPGGLCQSRFPVSLIYVVSPWPAVPSTFMPLPSRSTSAGPPVILDTALLPCSSLPPVPEETRSDCFCPDGCAPRGNVRYIVATLAAAKILQSGSASTD